jgi:hypothetical protein
MRLAPKSREGGEEGYSSGGSQSQRIQMVSAGTGRKSMAESDGPGDESVALGARTPDRLCPRRDYAVGVERDYAVGVETAGQHPIASIWGADAALLTVVADRIMRDLYAELPCRRHDL